MLFWLIGVAMAQDGLLREEFKHPFGSRAPVVETLNGLMQSDWDIQHYDIEVSFDVRNSTLVKGVSRIRAKARRDNPGGLLLHSNGPKIDTMLVEGASAEFAIAGQEVWVTMPETVSGDERTVEVAYESSLGEGQGLGVHWDGETLFSFHEPQGARLWLVTFDDPADKATLDWHIQVDSDLVVAANGELLTVEENGEGQSVWHFRFDELIPTYLMVVHASDYEVLEDETVDGKPIRHHIHPGTTNQAWRVFERTPEILELFSSQFGDYPWASYGHAIAPFGGAMEHTTMTTFGDGLLGSSYGELVNAHEVAHHWFGDYVTLADWPEIWLNEGFASYGEVLWYEIDNGEIGRRRYVDSQVESYFNWQQYEGVSSVYDPNYMFGGAVYDKGSIVLDMLRTLLGDDLFFEGVQNYVDRFAHSNATTSDLVDVLNETTGEDLNWFFEQWVYWAGDPVVAMGVEQREVAEGVWQLDVVLTQETSDLWTLPVVLAWSEDGERVEEEVWLTEREQVFTFCLNKYSQSHVFDPDGLLLLDDLKYQNGVEVPVTCVEEEELPEEEELVDEYPLGQGGSTLEVGGCNAVGQGTKACLVALLAGGLLVSLRRRES